MHQSSELTRLRIERFVDERLEPAKYRARVALDIAAWRVPGEPVPFDVAAAADFEEFAVGQTWGAPWSTVWFHVTGSVPAGWPLADTRVELCIDLGFDDGQPGFQAEGLVYANDGSILKAIEPYNDYVRISGSEADTIDVFVEAAGNPDVGSKFRRFVPTQLGRLETAGTDDLYRMRAVDVALLDVPVWELLQDIWTLLGLAAELDDGQPRRAEILRALDSVVDAVDPLDVSGTASAARRLLEAALTAPASSSAHRIVAVGHAHIDSAWLWPVRETVRKCARTFSNVLALMDEDPELIFACSSAQQLSWIKEYYPALFERIRQRVAEGRFVPVGGMWVESDTNMPSGESLVRQFVEGKTFFMEEFGSNPSMSGFPTPLDIPPRCRRSPSRRGRRRSSRRSSRGTRSTGFRTTASSGKGSMAPGSSRTSHPLTSTIRTCRRRSSPTRSETTRRVEKDAHRWCRSAGGMAVAVPRGK